MKTKTAMIQIVELILLQARVSTLTSAPSEASDIALTTTMTPTLSTQVLVESLDRIMAQRSGKTVLRRQLAVSPMIPVMTSTFPSRMAAVVQAAVSAARTANLYHPFEGWSCVSCPSPSPTASSTSAATGARVRANLKSVGVGRAR